MIVLLGVGLSRLAFGGLPTLSIHKAGMSHRGKAGDGLFMGAALFVVLRAFASGGGGGDRVEAISNGVPPSASRPGATPAPRWSGWEPASG